MHITYRFDNALLFAEGGETVRADGSGRLQQHDICLRSNWFVHRGDKIDTSSR